MVCHSRKTTSPQTNLLLYRLYDSLPLILFLLIWVKMQHWKKPNTKFPYFIVLSLISLLCVMKRFMEKGQSVWLWRETQLSCDGAICLSQLLSLACWVVFFKCLLALLPPEAIFTSLGLFPSVLQLSTPPTAPPKSISQWSQCLYAEK